MVKFHDRRARAQEIKIITLFDTNMSNVLHREKEQERAREEEAAHTIAALAYTRAGRHRSSNILP